MTTNCNQTPPAYREMKKGCQTTLFTICDDSRDFLIFHSGGYILIKRLMHPKWIAQSISVTLTKLLVSNNNLLLAA